MISVAFVLLGASVLGPIEDGPIAEFEFVLSQKTGKHIAIQPMPDHHRIYFPIRVKNWEGRRAFARVRTATRDGQGETVQETLASTLFTVETDNDLWSIYLRAPRYKDRTAIYQVELGTYEPDNVNDVYQVRQAFAWEVDRDPQGQARFVHERPDGSVVVLGIPHRILMVVGGEIKIQYAHAAPQMIDLVFGVDQVGAQYRIDGEIMATKSN